MFGMGFMEILLIAVVAIIALGPEKLPGAMVDIAKFIKKLKSGIEDAKSTFDEELNISEMRKEADKFKAQIENTKSSFAQETKIDLGLDNIMKDGLVLDLDEQKEEEVIEKLHAKEEFKKEIKEDKKVEKKKKNSNKFKVNLKNNKKGKA